MSTVGKAMTLLGFFSSQAPEIGQSELARLAEFDKATTRRLLLALAEHGLVEQNPESKKFRLGAGILRLARVREATFPIEATVQPTLEKLVSETGETAHFSLAAGGILATVGLVESARGNRVSLEAGEALPLHATASGIVYLAFADKETRQKAIKQILEIFTDHTITKEAELSACIELARRDGTYRSDHSYETDVCGIAAPVFDWSGHACGAVAVASPTPRVNAAVEAKHRALVRSAAAEITRGLGAETPAILLRPEPSK